MSARPHYPIGENGLCTICHREVCEHTCPADPRDALVASPHPDIFEQVSSWLRSRWGWLGIGQTDNCPDEVARMCEAWAEVCQRYGHSSPAASGCLLALVRKAWGPCVTISHVDGPMVRSTTISDIIGAVLFRRSGAEPGVRLAAALLAAPISSEASGA